ncbi:hypothetical protein PPYR_14891 [Photinus pyralis]|uniref:Uncharacterized protein n=1 Tax=Photinus pyralis TaxID=7054 RepID=A0A5N4A014_PHOPY|nr:hypothetical protein PPYR_14891 [Photinus pyralis]
MSKELTDKCLLSISTRQINRIISNLKKHDTSNSERINVDKQVDINPAGSSNDEPDEPFNNEIPFDTRSECFIESGNDETTFPSECKNDDLDDDVNALNDSFNMADVLSDSLQRTPSFANDLRLWAIKNKIPHSALSELMKILLKHNIKSDELPSDSRTLLKTPRSTVIRPVKPGNYLHFGVLPNLRAIKNP